MRTLEPVGEYLVVVPVKAKEETESGILLTGGAVEVPSEGVVQSCGEDVVIWDHENGTDRPMFAVGAHVLYAKYAGTEITLDGETFLVLKPNDIFGIIRETPALKETLADVLTTPRTPFDGRTLDGAVIV